jgi:hypothetical protein
VRYRPEHERFLLAIGRRESDLQRAFASHAPDDLEFVARARWNAFAEQQPKERAIPRSSLNLMVRVGRERRRRSALSAVRGSRRCAGGVRYGCRGGGGCEDEHSAGDDRVSAPSHPHILAVHRVGQGSPSGMCTVRR